MSESISCPHCAKKLSVPDHLLGRNVKCPGCANTFQVIAPIDEGDSGLEKPRPRRDADAFTERPARRSASSHGDDDRRYRDDRDEDDLDRDDDYRPRRRRRRRRQQSSAEAAVNVCGISMLVVGILGILMGVANIATVLAGPGFGGNARQQQPGYQTGRYAGATLSLVWGAIVTVGGFNLKTLRSHGAARTGAIFALLPCNPCCLAGLPLGIWALMIMGDRDVQDSFQ